MPCEATSSSSGFADSLSCATEVGGDDSSLEQWEIDLANVAVCIEAEKCGT